MAKEYLEKALAIKTEIGDIPGEAADYGNLGNLFHSRGDYAKAIECHKKALSIQKEIGCRKDEATSFRSQGSMFGSLGDYNKAQKHLQKALVIKRKIGDKQGEAIVYGNLGTLFQTLGDYVKAIEKAEECHEKSLALSEQIRCVDLQFSNRLHLTYDTLLLKGNVNKVVSNLLKGIQKCEEMRGFLRDHDRLKISF